MLRSYNNNNNNNDNNSLVSLISIDKIQRMHKLTIIHIVKLGHTESNNSLLRNWYYLALQYIIHIVMPQRKGDCNLSLTKLFENQLT